MVSLTHRCMLVGLLVGMCIGCIDNNTPSVITQLQTNNVTNTIDIGGQHIIFSHLRRLGEEGSEEFCIATTNQGGVAFAPMILCDK